MLISSKHVGDSDDRIIHLTSVGLNGVTSIVLYYAIAVVRMQGKLNIYQAYWLSRN